MMFRDIVRHIQDTSSIFIILNMNYPRGILNWMSLEKVYYKNIDVSFNMRCVIRLLYADEIDWTFYKIIMIQSFTFCIKKFAKINLLLIQNFIFIIKSLLLQFSIFNILKEILLVYIVYLLRNMTEMSKICDF